MKKSKSSHTVLIVSILLLAAGAGWYFFNDYKNKNANPASGLKPRVEMGIGKISNITDSTMDMTLNLLVHNPLPVGLDIKALDYMVKMNGVTIVEDNYKKPLRIKAQDSTLVSMPSKLKLSKLVKMGDRESARDEDSVTYHLTSVLHLAKPFLGKDSLELSIDKRLPLVQIPKIELEGFDLEKFRLSKSEVVVKMKVINENNFSIEFRNPTYVMDVGKQKRFAEGAIKGVTKIKKKSSGLFEIPMAIDMGKILKTTGQMIAKGKDLPYTMYFKSKIVSDNEMLNNSNINMIINGNLEDVRAVKKNLINKESKPKN